MGATALLLILAFSTLNEQDNARNNQRHGQCYRDDDVVAGVSQAARAIAAGAGAGLRLPIVGSRVVSTTSVWSAEDFVVVLHYLFALVYFLHY